MRKSTEIKAEIDKLNVELKASVRHELKVSSAVNVLENLGWTHNGSRWVKPVQPIKIKEYRAPVAAGALASWDGGVVGGHVYVRSVRGTQAIVSRIQNVTVHGVQVHDSTFSVHTEQLTVRPKEFFIGRKL